jgi:predicted O-linked N-acetylglucosamine transferase (SPINDLY family)
MSAIASEPPRNAPCPCGSGKRYKDCHGALQPPLATGGVAPLLAGLPVVTGAGETLVSRMAGSQLHAIGLPELVTASLAEYEALALRLAREPDTLSALRAKLAANRHTHPLFDMARYTQDFEALLLHTWDERHRL